MLGKLFKHEFRETGRLMLPLNLVIIAFTIIGCILLASPLFFTEQLHLEILAVASLLLYIFSIIAIFIVSLIFFTIRFYKTMYSSQGYLTHTLPVSTGSIINVKLATSSFWTLLTTVLTIASVCGLIASALTHEISSTEYQELIEELSTVFGGNFIPLSIISVVVSSIVQLLVIYVSLAIGQLFNQFRVLASIITYVVLYIAQQILGTVTSLLLQVTSLDIFMTGAESNTAFQEFYDTTFSIGIIESVVLGIIFYVLLYWLTSKKLNLE